jgi:hypothetical protein
MKKSETTILGGVGGAESNRPFPDITPEQAEWLKRQPIRQAKPKLLHVEVSQRTFDAVRAKPERLVVRAEDAQGNAVFEKPAAAGRSRTGRVRWGEALSEAEIGTEAYNRLRTPSAAEGGPCRSGPEPVRPQAPAGTPAAAWGGGGTDQHWKPKRGWDGETRYVPDPRSGRADQYVVSDYDIFAVLKE